MVCGCCSYVCPSNIPLSQLFKLAKAALKRQAPVA
jgi:electron transport complex protein RnfC